MGGKGELELDFRDVRLMGRSLDHFNQIKNMSKQQSVQGKQQGATTTPQVGSRLARTNPGGQQVSRLAYNSNLATDIFPFSSKKEAEQPSTRVPPTDRNTTPQQSDKKKTSNYPSTSSSTINPPSSVATDEGTKAMGLISNAFLGATNKFVRGNVPQTPVKIIQQVAEQTQDTPKGASGAKFSRNKETVEQKSRTISMRNAEIQPEAPSTDRSQLQGAKKIGRRPAAGTRELKFAEKKEEKVEQTPEKVLTTVVTPASRKTEIKTEVKSEVKTETKEEQSYPRLYQQPAQKPQRIVRSRLVTQTPKQEPEPVKQPEPVVQTKPKETAKPVNRLVASRLQQQTQLAQSKVEQSKPAQSKVSENASTTKPVPSRSNIKLTPVAITQPEIVNTPPPVQEEVKPKPYTRSFITRKNQTNTEMASSAVTGPTATGNRLSVNNAATLSQSNIVKTQEPPNTEKSKAEQKEAQQQAIVLKKSACASLIIKRLLTQTLSNTFLLLKANKQTDKLKKTNECSILAYSITNITKIKEQNLIKLAFENLKKKFTANYITSLKSYAEAPTANYKNATIALIDRVFSAKIRNAFRILREASERARNRVKGVTTLQSFIRRKISIRMRDSLSAVQLRQKNRSHILNQLSAIVAGNNKNKLAIAFSKITTTKPASPAQSQPQSTPLKSTPQRGKSLSRTEQTPAVINTSNPALLEKLQKLKTATASLNTQISTLQSSLQKKKKTSQTQKTSLNERITLLKHQNEQINNEIQIKKHRSEQIKGELQTSLPKDHQSLEEQLTSSRESKLQFLTNLYISSYKNPEQPITVDDLLSNYNLRPLDSSSPLFLQWSSIHLNLLLKRTIAAYESPPPSTHKGRSNLLAEQALISKLIRSYIKEQYFWQWIHLSAQNI